MTKTGSAYFRDQLIHWFKTLDFYRNEIPQFEERLVEVIQRNTSLELASQAESFLNQFAELHNKINLLQMEIERLKTDHSAHGRNNGSAQLQPQVQPQVQPQDSLRENMMATERDFVETKYNCHQFLAKVYSAA
jgi:uncharacterized small protein (DUF1192 family)